MRWIAQHPSAQSGLISNVRTQGDKSSLSTELFFQVMFVNSKIKGAGETPVHSGCRRHVFMQPYYLVLLLWYTKNFTASLTAFNSPFYLLTPGHSFVMQLQRSLVFFPTEKCGRNVIWSSVRDYKKCEYLGNIPLFYTFKSFIRLKDQLAKPIYSHIPILCSTVYCTFFSTQLFLFLLFI